MAEKNDLSELIAALNELMGNARKNRKDTKLVGLKMEAPWADEVWEGVDFYNAQKDPQVQEKDAMCVRYMTGKNIPPHVTLAIADSDQAEKVQIFLDGMEAYIPQFTFKCKGIHAFGTTAPAKALGARGHSCVVMLLQPSTAVTYLRDGAYACIPIPRDMFQGVDKPAEWKVHMTVGYVANKESEEALRKQLAKYVGQDVKVLGWA